MTLDNSNSSPTEPLDTEVSKAWSAYQQRRDRKKGSKSASDFKDPTQFLSDLPEIESDIQFRFDIIVVGEFAMEVAMETCSSEAARALLGDHDGPLEVRRVPSLPQEQPEQRLSSHQSLDTAVSAKSQSSSNSNQEEKPFGQSSSDSSTCSLYSASSKCSLMPGGSRLVDKENRCLVNCRRGADSHEELVKLHLRPVVSFLDPLPEIKTVQEAESSCIVFVFRSEWSDEEKQLQALRRRAMEFDARQKQLAFTTFRALLVVSWHDQEPRISAELLEFAKHFSLEVFQSSVSDANGLHQVFANFAENILCGVDRDKGGSKSGSPPKRPSKMSEKLSGLKNFLTKS